MASQQERLSKLEQMTSDIKEDVAEIKITLKDQDAKWELRISKMEGQFASKWVEAAARAAGVALAVGFFGGLFYWLFVIVLSNKG